MKILVTGGNTAVPIDRVRVISNIFRGKTGVAVAAEAHKRGHEVTLVGNPGMRHFATYRFVEYKTFDDLEAVMKREICGGGYDAVVHSAAVSDYSVSRVLGPDMSPLDSSGKVGSNHDRIYLELVKTKKIVDEIRKPWNFRGVLVKFKLQVRMIDEELLEIARNSRVQSSADVIVANCLEWSRDRAYVVTKDGQSNVSRDELPSAILNAVEFLKKSWELHKVDQ